MNGVNDPLSKLNDIHMPDPVGWWPPAPGWWVVGFCGLALFIGGGYFLWKFYQRDRYRREALAALWQLRESCHEPRVLLEEISLLLRRVAMARYGRKEVASLSGNDWLAFLDRTGKTEQFGKGAGSVLGDMLYQPQIEVDGENLCRVVESWIRRRR